jgi:hypothetical protein
MTQYRIADKLSDQQKNDVISLLAKNASSLLQHPEWVELSQPGRKKLYFTAYNEEGELICYALISVKLWHGIIWFAPVCPDWKCLPEFVYNLAYLSKSRGIGLLSIVNLFSDEIRNSILAKIKKKYHISWNNCVNSWATIKVNLQQTEAELFSQYSNNHKRAIKKAVKYGFSVRQIEQAEDIVAFSMLYNKMYQKRKLNMPVKNPEKMFNEIVCFFNRTSNIGSIWGVYDNEKLIGGLVLGHHGKTAFYHYGASDKDIQNKPVMHILFYEAMKALKQIGFISFDLGGYAQSSNIDPQLSNINQFKRGFGGNIINYGDPINIILSKPKYYIIIYLKTYLRKRLAYIRKHF